MDDARRGCLCRQTGECSRAAGVLTLIPGRFRTTLPLMNEERYFAGRLLRQSLPSVVPAPGTEMPLLKRLVLKQGELAQIHDSDLGIRYIAAPDPIPGGIRGNPYPDVKIEHVYVMRGEMELIAQDGPSGDCLRLPMKAGDLAVIQPGVIHAFRVIREGVGIEFAPTPFDPADVHPHSLA